MNTSTVLATAFAMMLAGTIPAPAAKAPIGKSYFVVTLGVATDDAEGYALDAGCVRFTRTRICDSDNDCGTWWWMEGAAQARKQWQIGFEFQLIDDETGLPVEIHGVGRVDARGPRSSIAAAAHGIEPTSGERINFALAGRAVGSIRCQQLVADFLAQ